MGKSQSLTEPTRQILHHGRVGTLATSMTTDGTAYASLVNVAFDGSGAILLLSDLAWHTKNLVGQPRGSLLMVEDGQAEDRLETTRITVLGSFTKTLSEGDKQFFLQKHPAAEFYAGFADFSFWRLHPEQIHAIAGFGRIETLGAAEIFSDL